MFRRNSNPPFRGRPRGCVTNRPGRRSVSVARDTRPFSRTSLDMSPIHDPQFKGMLAMLKLLLTEGLKHAPRPVLRARKAPRRGGRRTI
jgi:hypothetical protein